MNLCNKNVTEVFDVEGHVAAAYDYSPYGMVSSTGELIQPMQWSSEMNDDKTKRSATEGKILTKQRIV